LAADVLVQRTIGSTRSPAIEIDSARLLGRVARAFVAAQERDSEVRLRLSPPELGSLLLEVHVQDGVLIAQLQTETEAARTAIVDNLAVLRDRLNEQGLRIERFEVDLMQRQPGGMPDHTGGRRHDAPEVSARVAPLPRPRSETTGSSTAQLLTPVGVTDGLNVII
jgi:flagellar hook-length control protein FliK